jgi:sugar-phosphatase
MRPDPRLTPRALLFDMDGLLVDSEPLWYRVEAAFAAARGGVWTEALARECVGCGIPSTLARMRDALGVAIDPVADETAIVDAFVARAAELSPKPGSRELLLAARGRVRLALASSSPARLIRATLDALGLGAAFDAVVSGDAVARPKPAPEIFLRAAGELGVAPSSCVVLEDSLAGCRAGRDAGAYVIAVPEGDARGRGYEEVADAIVADLFEARARLDLGG